MVHPASRRFDQNMSETLKRCTQTTTITWISFINEQTTEFTSLATSPRNFFNVSLRLGNVSTSYHSSMDDIAILQQRWILLQQVQGIAVPGRDWSVKISKQKRIPKGLKLDLISQQCSRIQIHDNRDFRKAIVGFCFSNTEWQMKPLPPSMGSSFWNLQSFSNPYQGSAVLQSRLSPCHKGQEVKCTKHRLVWPPPAQLFVAKWLA